jgi:hypothetical protein
MLEFIVWLSIISMYAIIIGTLIILPLLRLITVLVNKTSMTESLKIVFIPLSIGYYLNIQKNKTLHYIYVSLHILIFILSLFACIILFYTRFA